MKITCGLFLLSALVVSFAFSSYAQSNPTYTVLVGTYTDKTSSKGIYAFEFNSETGKLTPKGLAAQSTNPSWAAIHPDGKFAYAANESGEASMVSAFSLDSATGKLTLLNQVPALGEDPCYLAFDKTGKYLFAANYTSGTVTAFPILPDGKLGRHSALVKDAGTLGPNKQRQEGSHAHWVQVSPDNRSLYVSDLGLDEIVSYPFDPVKGYLRPNGSPFAKPAPGSGPRHSVFSADNKFLYVLSEIKSTITVFSGADGKPPLRSLQAVSTLPASYNGRKEAAEIAIHPSGKWLFASNRGYDSIAVFSIDPQKGTLTPAGIFPTGGKEPRHFALDPTGQFLLAENQFSNSIVVFRINTATGALTQVSQTADIPSPVCLVFVP
ncbi:MAG TPA: lactonase family protein [Candidatus Eisenbacteria bacterium]|nr:lactonase family protein [Candidatus Eisenbacteria bacterium]